MFALIISRRTVDFLYMNTMAYPMTDKAEWIMDERQSDEYPFGVTVAALTYLSNGYI